VVAQRTAARIARRRAAEQIREQFFRLSLGWSEAELMSTPWMELIHPDDRERLMPAANAFLDEVSNPRLEKPFDSHRSREMVQKLVE
jgi:hypothetical protein